MAGRGPLVRINARGSPVAPADRLSLIRRRHRGAHSGHGAAILAAGPDRPEPHPALEQELDRQAGQQDEKADEHDDESE